MPRKNRLHYRNAFYHVMLRGNYRQAIFIDDKDREILLEHLEKAVNTFNCKIHLFCLMTNHIHLVVEVSAIPISKIIQSIFSCYVKMHNARFNKIGRLFQDRFKAKRVCEDAYFLELCHYIHHNPIKAKMCQSLDEYPWSSHLNYAKIKNFSWLTTSHIEKLLKNYVDAESDHYYYFISDRDHKYSQPSFFEVDENNEIIIKDSINKKLANTPMLALENIPLRKIAMVICDDLNISIDMLKSESQCKTVMLAKVLVTYYGHYHAKYYLKDIALVFNMRADSLSRTLNRYLKKMYQDAFLKAAMTRIECKLATSDPDKLII